MQLKTYFPRGSLEFDPDFDVGNCYAYALNIRDAAYNQPGDLRSGNVSRSFGEALKVNNLKHLRKKLKSDGLLRIHFHGARRNSQILAAFLDPESDFHFYRKHSDGAWSHRVACKTTNLDSSGDVISHPMKSNRDFGSPDTDPYQACMEGRLQYNYHGFIGANYRKFVGYYLVPNQGIEYLPSQ